MNQYNTSLLLYLHVALQAKKKNDQSSDEENVTSKLFHILAEPCNEVIAIDTNTCSNL